MLSTKEVSYSRSPGHNGPSTTTPRLELSKLLNQADNATLCMAGTGPKDQESLPVLSSSLLPLARCCSGTMSTFGDCLHLVLGFQGWLAQYDRRGRADL